MSREPHGERDESQSTVEEKAQLLLSEIKRALAAGTHHYHPETGALLKTPREIVECLLACGSVRLVAVDPSAN